jgi:hypothetical protein
VEVFFLHLSQRTAETDARVVDERIETASRARHGVDGRGDIAGARHVKPQRADIRDGIEILQVLLLARAGVDEVALFRQTLGDLAPDPGAGARDQHGLLGIWRGSGCRVCSHRSVDRYNGHKDESDDVIHHDLP